jgi:hypothetical protein
MMIERAMAPSDGLSVDASGQVAVAMNYCRAQSDELAKIAEALAERLAEVRYSHPSPVAGGQDEKARGGSSLSMGLFGLGDQLGATRERLALVLGEIDL